MHCFCLVIHKKQQDLHTLLNSWCDENNGRWDYASIGGRYRNIIPVSILTKSLDPSVSAHPFDNPDYGGDPHCKYVDVARVRNINIDEAIRMRDEHELSVLHPYSFIIADYMWGDDDPIEVELARDADMYDILTNPKYQSWYITAVDYHI